MEKMERNLTMLMDWYELTMSNEYFLNGMKDTVAYFDLFYRKHKNGFIISAGLSQAIEIIKNMHFTEGDIEFLRSKNVFSEEFLGYLKSFKFSGDIWAIEEGVPVFPNEPIMTIKAPIIDAQIAETILLTTINFQSLVATKASRIVKSAQGRPVYEFGSRRAHSYDAAIYGARAAMIGGCAGTACTIVAKMFDVPVVGTMAHSNVQLMDSEYDAFKMYAKTYPSKASFLVDTYNVLKSGIPNAIRVWDELAPPKGERNLSIRLDSGDLAYLSIHAREQLDAAGYDDVKIGASNSLDENVIKELLMQGAKIDWFGVGENLITSKSEPVLGGVYKLVAVEKDGVLIPKIKVSENTEKVTNPSFKKLYRFYDKTTGKAIADLIVNHDEAIDESKPYEIFDPADTWKRRVLENFKAVELQTKIFEGGECIYKEPSLKEICDRCAAELDTLWDEVKRLENPHRYNVDLSEKLWNIKDSLLRNHMVR